MPPGSPNNWTSRPRISAPHPSERGFTTSNGRPSSAMFGMNRSSGRDGSCSVSIWPSTGTPKAGKERGLRQVVVAAAVWGRVRVVNNAMLWMFFFSFMV
jgi:hypothetical protein